MSLPYWRLSGFYFFYFATLGSFLPFWSLYLKYQHFNAVEIGELTALMVATKIISPNLWGWLADHLGKSLGIIRGICLLAGVLFAGFLFKTDYFWFVWVTLAFSFFWNGELPLFEAAVLFHLKQEPQRYSQIRLWGSIGFIAAVLGIGWFLDWYPVVLLPYIILALFAGNWLVAVCTPEAPRRVANVIGQQSVFTLLCRPQALAFLLVYMLLQVAHGPYYAFYSLYLNQHGYPSTQIGLLWSLGVCAEIVLFMAIKPLLKRYDLRSILLIALLLSSARWFIIAHAVDSRLWMTLAQLLHAASFGATHTVAMQWLNQYFGVQHQSKGQALYASVCFGVGGMLGSLYSGYGWDSLGAEAVYLLAAIFCCLATLIALIWVRFPKQTT